MFEHLLVALALAMDCLAVSVVCGVIVRKMQLPIMLRLAVLFGLFQAVMPLIGWLLTSRFSSFLESVDHWIAFTMLAFIGGKMIVEDIPASEQDKAEHKSIDPRSFRTCVALAVATSIDALAVGISYACTGYETLSSLAMPLACIGSVSFIMSILGFILGVRFGEVVVKKVRPDLIGGLILIGIGIKILIEHLSAC